jgi:class 3 adenylate cyclase/TolB-like protein
MRRRIATILVADIVGYSAMMAADEEGTALRLAGWRELVDAEIAKCDGRLFKAMGDAVLAEFASPINAARCAVNIRSALAVAGRAGESPMRMRFGLHLADVLIENDDLIGDGVNLAARIQQAADPDAIDVSGALFEQIRRNSPFDFDDRGEQTFRNIAEPVRVYRLRGEIERSVFQVAPTQTTPVRAKRPHSLVVLPIEVGSEDEDRRYLADGVTEELILELSRFKKLFVISRSAARALPATDREPNVVGDRFGVRYVLSGTIRQLGPGIRLSLSLSETDTGGVVWSHRLSDTLENLIDRMDDLVARIASTVLGRIEDSDIAAARRAKPESMTAYDYYLRGVAYQRLGSIVDENSRQAIQWFDRAIEADPEFGRPLAMWVCARSSLPEFDEDVCRQRVERALELDPNDPDANRIMGSIQMHMGKFDAARWYHEKAMELSPSDAYIKGRSAAFYNFVGEPDRALQLLDEAGELDPFLHVWCVEERVATLYAFGRFREAIEAAVRLTIKTRRSRLYHAASLAALGEDLQARDVVAEAVAISPDLTSDYLRSQEFYRDPAVIRTLTERLIRAGLPASEHEAALAPIGDR